MTICRKCGKEIPDGEDLCGECKSKEISSGESYLDELMSSMGMMEEELDVSDEGNASDEVITSDEVLTSDEEITSFDTLPAEEPAAMDEADEMDALLDEMNALDEVLPEEAVPAEEPIAEPESAPEPMLEEPEPEPEPAPAPEPAEEGTLRGDEDINELLTMLSKDYDVDEDGEDDSALPEADEDTEVKIESLPEAELSLFDEEDDGGSIFADDTSVDDIFKDALSAVDYSDADDDEMSGGGTGDNWDDNWDGTLALDDTGVESEKPEEEKPVKVVETRKKQKKEKPQKEKKQDGFWKRTFGNIITEQTAEEEAKERELEQATAAEKAALKKEMKEKAAAEKMEKAEAAKAVKDQKAAEKAEKAAAKKAEKEEKKRQRAELAATEVVGKINPVGAAIVMVFFGLICVGVLVGTNVFSYSSSVKNASAYFDERNYKDAYMALSGVDVSEKSKELEDKIKICMQLQKQLDSYQNYYDMQMYLESLDSLMKGIRSYDVNKEKADYYEIMSQYNELEGKLAGTLYDEFGVSETQARDINDLDSQEEYTKELEKIIQNWNARMKEDER